MWVYFYYSTLCFISFISYVPFATVRGQTNNQASRQADLNSSTTSLNSSSSSISPPTPPYNVEILAIYVIPGIGNSIRVIWGGDFGKELANFTYGLHYGEDEGELTYPKLVTANLSAIIEDLEYCTLYNFAVTVDDGSGFDASKINPNLIRTIVTGIDPLAAPTNLTIDLEPLESPCLVIKWSAACPNVVYPVGYVLSVFEKNESRYKIITFPPNKRSDLIYKLGVTYGEEYEIRVSNNFPGAKAVGPTTYKVPDFLQPFKVKVAINSEEGAFMIYWEEPFVPLRVGRYYYQVFVYPGQDVTAPYEKYYVTRPVMVYKGERGAYSFSVNLASQDRKHVSSVTAPIYANLNGETFDLNVTLPEMPDR